MGTRVFISEKPKPKTSRNGDVLVHLAVYVNSSINQGSKTNAMPNRNRKKVTVDLPIGSTVSLFMGIEGFTTGSIIVKSN